MRKQIITTLLAVCALAVVLSGCSSGVPLTTIDGASYEVVSVATATEYASRVPSEGTKFLLVTVQGSDSELDDMQTIFYGADHKAMVTDGASTAECTLIVYAPRGGDKLDVVLLFQVPTSFAQDFTLYGDGFESVALSTEE